MDHFQRLPVKVQFLILSKTSPQDVARVSVVSKRFEEAARSDIVWNSFLPPDSREIVQSVHGGLLKHLSARDLYHRLAKFVVLGDGTEGYWIDRKTGGACLAFSGRALQIAWGDNPKYWTYGPKEGSRFVEVAQLDHVWWLELSKETKIRLPPGEYSVWWVLQVKGYGWADYGVKFYCTVESGQDSCTKVYDVELSRYATGWVSYNGGHFEVTGADEINLRVSMENKNCNYPKWGLWVDGIVLQPKDLFPTTPSNLDSTVCKSSYELSSIGSASEPDFGKKCDYVTIGESHVTSCSSGATAGKLLDFSLSAGPSSEFGSGQGTYHVSATGPASKSSSGQKSDQLIITGSSFHGSGAATRKLKDHYTIAGSSSGSGLHQAMNQLCATGSALEPNSGSIIELTTKGFKLDPGLGEQVAQLPPARWCQPSQSTAILQQLDDPSATGSTLESKSSQSMDKFQHLPVNVLFLIFSRTSPQDVARLSVVSKKFEEAARSDIVWKSFLPPDVRQIVQNVYNGPLIHDSAKDLYHKLASFVLLGDGTEGYWIDRKTGRVCLAFSGRALQIVWGDNPNYWTYGPKEGSRFLEVAQLDHVWWLELSKEMKIRLSPGEYTVWWVLQLEGYQWMDYGVKFYLTVESRQDLSTKVQDVELLRYATGWVAYNGGHFEVTEPDEIKLRVSMENKNCNYPKRGLLVDGITVQLDFPTVAASDWQPWSVQTVFQLSAAGPALQSNSRGKFDQFVLPWSHLGSHGSGPGAAKGDKGKLTDLYPTAESRSESGSDRAIYQSFALGPNSDGNLDDLIRAWSSLGLQSSGVAKGKGKLTDLYTTAGSSSETLTGHAMYQDFATGSALAPDLDEKFDRLPSGSSLGSQSSGAAKGKGKLMDL